MKSLRRRLKGTKDKGAEKKKTWAKVAGVGRYDKDENQEIPSWVVQRAF